MYISSWQEYQDAAEALYTKSPNSTRYCVKWRASEGKLVLKITDNTTCLKFKTYSSIFLNRFEALNLSLMRKMQNSRPPTVAVSTATAAAAVEGGPAVAVAVAQGVADSGGVKKKKPKKKK